MSTASTFIWAGRVKPFSSTSERETRAATEFPMEVTRTLARYGVNSKASDIPDAVKREGVRSILNWLGCAVGAARHEAVEAALAALIPFAGPAQASVLGRSDKTDILTAALLNGITSHVFDFDDTHLPTIIH